jgi:hypothetical protein
MSEYDSVLNTLLMAHDFTIQARARAEKSGGEMIAAVVGSECGPCPMFMIALVPVRDEIKGVEAVIAQLQNRLNQLKTAKAAQEN